MIVSRQFVEKLALLIISSAIMYYVSLKLVEETSGLDSLTGPLDVKKLEDKLKKNWIRVIKKIPPINCICISPEEVNSSFMDDFPLLT